MKKDGVINMQILKLIEIHKFIKVYNFTYIKKYGNKKLFSMLR